MEAAAAVEMMEDDCWEESFAIIHSINERIDQAIATAIHNEEMEDPQTAIINYKLSMMLIDQALATPVGLPDDVDAPPDDSWKETCKVIETMKRKHSELSQRVSQLTAKMPATTTTAKSSQQTAAQNDEYADPLNTDEDQFEMAIDCTDQPKLKRPWTYSELAAELKKIRDKSDEANRSKMQLVYVCDDVEFFHIEATGEVTKSEEKSQLRILCIDENEKQHLQATFFLQIIPASLSSGSGGGSQTVSLEIGEEVEYAGGLVDEEEADAVVGPDVDGAAALRTSRSMDSFDNPWIYPLIPDVSPCYFTKYGAFIFPDLHSPNIEKDTSIGVVVPKEYEEQTLDVLQTILNTVIHEATTPHRGKRSTSQAVSENIVRGASYISNGLIHSSTKVGEFLNKTTPYIMSKMNKAPSDYQPPVSSGVATSIEVAKTATGVAATVTGYVAGKVTSATVALGQYLAPHVQRQGTKLLSHTMGYSEDEASDKMTGAFVIAAGAVEGIGTVYSGLEQSATLLGNSLSTNSVRVISHKYGKNAGQLASGTFDTVGNVINISHNVGMLHPKSLVKKTAKNAAMFQRQPSLHINRPTIPASAMRPKLAEFSEDAISKLKKLD